MQDSAIQNTCWKSIHAVMVASFYSLTKNIYTGYT